MTPENTIAQRALQLWVDTFSSNYLPSRSDRLVALTKTLKGERIDQKEPEKNLDNSEAFIRVDELIKKMPSS